MEPLIKWAGGKRQLLPELKERMPVNYSRYVEPFVGSGALFLDVQPTNFVINDFNPELINLYKMVRDYPFELMRILDVKCDEFNSLDSEVRRAEYYYCSREQFNNNILSENLTIEDAALFILLNKTCFNGLYRVNSEGLFNVPFGKRKHVNLYNRENLCDCSKILKRAKIICGDFEEACKRLRAGSFVYFDSPYYDTFDTYQANGFSEQDHIRLATVFKRLSEKGVYCMASNSNSDFIKALYDGFDIEIVDVKRMINSNGKERTGQEVIITNYR